MLQLPQTFLSLFLTTLLTVSLFADEDAEAFFENKVRPLLVTRCHSCHGPDKQESDLRLDLPTMILQGGSSGEPAAIQGDKTLSLLLRYVRHEVEGMEMPPDDERLADSEIAILEKWVTDGLAWPPDNAPVVLTMEERLSEHRASHWAYRSPRVRPVDTASWSAEWRSWSQTGLDEYVMQRLLQRDLTPSSPADRRTLLRRIKFDLLGLPPTTDEVLAFERDATPDAMAQLVDRLLGSPQYGEHWGRHWLDVARYADTRGYSFQQDRNYPWAYTYRDYVIRAFNEGRPFDQFIVEQLAADLLPADGKDNRALAALGFLTVGRKFNDTHDDIDDKIDAVTRGFMGLTVACARCHDHKYDAIPTEDYYSLYGVFASSTEGGDLPLIGDAKTLANAREFEQRFSAVDGELKAYDSSLMATVTKDAHQRVTDYLIAASGDDSSSTDLRPQLVEAWRKFLKRKSSNDEPTLMPWFRLQGVAGADFSAAAEELANEINSQNNGFLNIHVRDAFVAKPPKSKRELAELYGSVLSAAYETWQKAGGDGKARAKQSVELRQLLWYFSDFNSPAAIDVKKTRRYSTQEEIAKRTSLQAAVDAIQQTKPVAYHRAMVMRDKPEPATAHVFIRGQAGRKGKKVARQAPLVLAKSNRRVFQHGSGRLELAQEIASNGNPLTARVFVNRVWLQHFGRPLVHTPSDFGVRSDPPVQQDLLDYLAARFMENGWSVKWLHREILLSATYQQSSGDRPELYAMDPENTLLWRANRKRLGFEATRDALLAVSGRLDMAMGGKAEKLFEKPELGRRRSVYGYVDRQDLPNLLRVFDFASPDQSAAQRTNTIVPQQALFLLNSPFALELADELAEADGWKSLSRDETVTLAYQKILARDPSDTEREISHLLLDHGEVTKLIHVLMLTNEFVYVD